MLMSLFTVCQQLAGCCRGFHLRASGTPRSSLGSYRLFHEQLSVQICVALRTFALNALLFPDLTSFPSSAGQRHKSRVRRTDVAAVYQSTPYLPRLHARYVTVHQQRLVPC